MPSSRKLSKHVESTADNSSGISSSSPSKKSKATTNAIILKK